MADAQRFDIPDSWGLTDKVAIVTGGGAAGDGIGNGRAAPILRARAGTRVIVVDRDIALAKRTVEMIEAGGGHGLAFQADMTRASDCAAVVEAAMDRYGRLDCLDNNVGIGSRGSVVDETEESWHRLMQVNVDTMFLAAKHAIPAMRRTGGRAIVKGSSISPPRLHRLLRREGRGQRADEGDGGRPRARGHWSELRRTRPGLHADGLPARHERGRPRPAAHRLGAEDRGNRLGHRPRRALPPVGLC